jgi:hypothetical protein
LFGINIRRNWTLCYKLEGHDFETLWGKLFFSIYLILLVALGPEAYSASNRREYVIKKTDISGEKSAAGAKD